MARFEVGAEKFRNPCSGAGAGAIKIWQAPPALFLRGENPKINVILGDRATKLSKVLIKQMKIR